MDEIDSRDLEPQQGFDLRAILVYDPEAQLDGIQDCDPSDEYVNAWKNDLWHYVGVVVEASRAGVVLGSDSIWGMEYGSFRNSDDELIDMDPLKDAPGFTVVDIETGKSRCPITFANGYGEGMVAEAIDRANETIAKINQKSTCETPAPS